MVKNPTDNAGDQGLITGLGRSLAEVNGKPLQYSFLGNAMEEEPSGLHTVHEVTKESDTN